MLTLPSLSSSSAEARPMSLLSGMCLICFMALMSSLTLTTLSLGSSWREACGTAPVGLPRSRPSRALSLGAPSQRGHRKGRQPEVQGPCAQSLVSPAAARGRGWSPGQRASG